MESIEAIEHIFKCMKQKYIRWYRSTSEGFADYLHLLAEQVPGAKPDNLATISEQAQFENALITELGYDGVCELTADQIADLYMDFDTTGTRIVDGVEGIHFVSNIPYLLAKNTNA